jgi:hypothetical protein
MSAVDGMWALVEQLGHRQLAGQLSEVEVAGQKMLRVDIPTDPPRTIMCAGASLYGITPITEEDARKRNTPWQPAEITTGGAFDGYIDHDDTCNDCGHFIDLHDDEGTCGAADCECTG